MTDRLDYEYELGNGWNRYQMLVLGELRRLADNDDHKTEVLEGISNNMAVLNQRFEDHIDAATETEKDFESRLRAEERATLTSDGGKAISRRVGEASLALIAIAISLGSTVATWIGVFPHHH